MTKKSSIHCLHHFPSFGDILWTSIFYDFRDPRHLPWINDTWHTTQDHPRGLKHTRKTQKKTSKHVSIYTPMHLFYHFPSFGNFLWTSKNFENFMIFDIQGSPLESMVYDTWHRAAPTASEIPIKRNKTPKYNPIHTSMHVFYHSPSFGSFLWTSKNFKKFMIFEIQGTPLGPLKLFNVISIQNSVKICGWAGRPKI